MKCVLCGSSKVEKYWEKVEKKRGKRVYFSCDECRLVFLAPEYRISAEAEKEIYMNHENSPEDEGYVQFLEQLIEPLTEKIALGSCGLDFGSGPGPTLHTLMKKRGFFMEHYDPFFHPDTTLLEKKYDFITSTEAAEHFFSPLNEFQLLNRLLKEKGSILGVMTKVLTDEIHFPDWWYHRDPTHIVFYRRETMAWIANSLQWQLEEPRDNVFLFM